MRIELKDYSVVYVSSNFTLSLKGKIDINKYKHEPTHHRIMFLNRLKKIV